MTHATAYGSGRRHLECLADRGLVRFEKHHVLVHYALAVPPSAWQERLSDFVVSADTELMQEDRRRLFDLR